ncbi:AAA family ATPase [Planctomycetota bacterium]|nr:AAA family ATPase [Planctomycetota bacterium]
MDLLITFGLASTIVLILGFVAYTFHLISRYKAELPKIKIVEKIEALEEQKDEVESQLEELRDKRYKAQSIIEEADRRLVEMDSNQDECERLNNELANLQQEAEQLERLRDEAAELNSKIAEIESKKLENESLAAQLESQVRSLNEELSNLNNLRSEMHDLESRLPSLKSEKSDLELQIDTLRGKLEGLEEEWKELQEKINTGRGELAEFEGKVKSLEESYERLKVDIDKKRESFEAEIKSHNDHLASLKTDIRGAGGLDENDSKLDDLWKSDFKPDENLDTSSTEIERLERLSATLKNAGVRIATRTVHSFHTALKTQSISPLTVLAGISGTGKSLLPKLYSDCMGIKFLNMAVQPGWNSPQDMFGFYNYIEQKYKGTPLARAMIQFDEYLPERYWNEGDNFHRMNEQVLLVLLDEMNLARIEYYFSELLSRLELRRLINEDDKKKRSEVAIPLEIGHASGESDKLDIYPGRNILFTGTMNEDESTQSLSDKVLDRASVLRFGKPEKYVTGQIDTNQFTGDPLSFNLWKKWLDNRDPMDSSLVDFVNEMGEVLHMVGSPFGHRVSQGIVEYVCQYPDQDKKAAMADQIEQKILPKLRGKEMREVGEALTRLETAVDVLGDAQLLQAIKDGREGGSGAFIWRGLDRAASDFDV